MQDCKKLIPGTVVIVQGGKYHGHGAQIRKVNAEAGNVQVMIAGQIRTLKIERVSHG